jgi:hypothetical protein
MHCPSCSRTALARSRRVSLIDQILCWFGRWPYRCLSCNQRFYSTQRWPPRQAGHQDGRKASRAEQWAPTAQIVVKAETHKQLDSLLLALHTAISSHEAKRPETASASRR